MENQKLREARVQKHWTIETAAEKVGVSWLTYSRWEHGTQEPRFYNVDQLCNLFHRSAADLGLTQRSLTSATNACSVQIQQAPELTEPEGTTVDRRQFLQSLSTIGATIFTPSQSVLNIEPWDRFSKVLKRPSAIDETTLNHLEALVSNSWQLIPDVTGVASSELRDYTINQLRNVTELLEGSLTDNTRKKLTSIGGEFSMIVASMSANLRDFNKALSYYNVSIEAAQEANNHQLEAVGLASLAIRLTHLDQADKALPLVQEARRITVQNDTITTRTWLAAVEAEVQANLKNYKDCFRALDDAEHVPLHYLASEDPYMTTFSPSLFAGYKGVCHMQFDEPEAAYKVLSEALTHLNTPSISRRCYILSDLVSACIQRKEITETCSYARQALAFTIQAKSPALWQRINDIHQQLEPWKDIQVVKDFNEQLYSTKK